MKLSKISGIFILSALLVSLVACEEETTTIGSAIASGEVEITVDTFYFNLMAKPIEIDAFDSKTGNLMIGNIETKDYGKLNCSFVTRLMCSPSLQVADSLFYPERVDSCKLILGAVRNEIIGDSLAPQKMAIYTLNKQLPSDIDNNFNPDGYYDPTSPFASRSYTVSGIAESDSLFYANSYIELTVDLPVEFGKEIFTKYKEEPEIFQWPQTMAEKFLPGLYVTSTFGQGCIANIMTAYIAVFYYNYGSSTSITEDGDTISKVNHINNVVFPFAVSPEVLSSNNISYTPSEKIINKNSLDDGEVVITTPGGYMSSFSFPAQTLIDRYNEKNIHLSTVNDLLLYIPAEPFDDDSGISIAQNLLMIKASEYDDFFADNKTPDNKTSFTGVYDAENKRYVFTSLRTYFLNLLQKTSISPEDLEFMLVPVEIETDTASSYYTEGTTYVTKCVPYTSRPTMTLLKTDEAMATFSFSTQMID